MISANTVRSNHSIFIPCDTGSPKDGVMAHIARLDQMARLDFERCSVAGDVIFAIEGDASPVPQQDEEARIGTLGYALKKRDLDMQAHIPHRVEYAQPLDYEGFRLLNDAQVGGQNDQNQHRDRCPD